jgi:cytochrome c peroxidase
MSMRRFMAVVALTLVSISAWWVLQKPQPPVWTEAEIRLIQSLMIGNLPPLSPNPTNFVSNDPRAADLGHQLFFDKRLSTNGQIACATCHQPDNRFTDSPLQKGRAIGETRRHTPSIVGAAYSPWMFWDGRRDSLWAQALAPLEDSNEHGGNRLQTVRLVATDPAYRQAYQDIFGGLPDFSDANRFPDNAAPVEPWNTAWQAMAAADRNSVNRVFANIGKSIAAYERLLLPGASRFDDYAKAVTTGKAPQQILNQDEVTGLQLFIGRANCTQCHNGPLLTNNEFHNTGITSFIGEVPDKGRVEGVREVQSDPFNCLGLYSDASPENCMELLFTRTGVELIGAVRTPSLRNLAGTEPFMHKGQMIGLMEVLEHYNQAPLALIGHNEAEPLDLNQLQLKQLAAFLKTLDAPIAAEQKWLQAPARFTD